MECGTPLLDLLDVPLLYAATCFPALLDECSHRFFLHTMWIDIHTFHKICMLPSNRVHRNLRLSNILLLSLFALVFCVLHSEKP